MESDSDSYYVTTYSEDERIDQNMPSSSVSNVPNDDVWNEHYDSDQGEDIGNELAPDNEGLSSSIQSHGSNSLTPHTSRATKKRRAKTVDQTYEVLTLVTERLSHNNDQFTIFGNNIAAKLETLPRETKLYTEKLINDILFEAEMDRVTKATKIVSLLDSTEDNPQVTLNRGASVHSYYFPQPNTCPLQIAPPQQHN